MFSKFHEKHTKTKTNKKITKPSDLWKAVKKLFLFVGCTLWWEVLSSHGLECYYAQSDEKSCDNMKPVHWNTHTGDSQKCLLRLVLLIMVSSKQTHIFILLYISWTNPVWWKLTQTCFTLFRYEKTLPLFCWHFSGAHLIHCRLDRIFFPLQKH